jgi:hypothetical protein
VNARDNRFLIVLLCGGLLVGAGLLVYNLFWVPLAEANAQIDKLEESNRAKKAQVERILRDKEKLRQWRALSLPGVENLPQPPPGAPRTAGDQERKKRALHEAKDRYLTYLRGLLKRHKLVHEDPVETTGEPSRNVPQAAPNVPVYTSLAYNLHAAGKYEQIVALLAEIETTPLLQRVRKVTIKKAAKTSTAKGPKEPLTVSLTVEALIVNGAAPRGDSLFTLGQTPTILDGTSQMLRGLPSGLSALPWQELYARAVSPKGRDYQDIGRKNIFEGYKPPPPKDDDTKVVPPKKGKPPELADLLSKAFLMDVTVEDEDGAQPRATVFDRLSDKANKLRTSYGWNWIPLLKDAGGSTLIRGKVLRITTAGLVFHVQLFAQNPAEESEKRRFQKDDVIYQLYKTDVEKLVKAKVITKEEASRTYKIPVMYWAQLLEDEVVQMRWGEFAFKHNLVRGRVLKGDSKRDGPFVLIRLNENYCSFDGGERTVRPHAGYCFLKIGEWLTQALQTPLQARDLKELKLDRVAAAP